MGNGNAYDNGIAAGSGNALGSGNVSYIDSAETDEEKERKLSILQDIVQRIFGKPIKLSGVVPSQQELLELVVQEFHNLSN